MLLHAEPAAGFDEPFALLGACHDRVRRMLALLERLQAHVARHGADPDARSAARDVLRYFDIAAPLHHEDEERHVFPLLRAAGQAALADRLQADHLAMKPAWAAVRATLTALAEGRTVRPEPGAWEAFAVLYRRHLQDEDAQAYPLAAARSGPEAQAAMGAEMAARRGVNRP